MGSPAGRVPATSRAGNVCHACMQRKKACDKALPACGFCAARRQPCRYDLSAPRTQKRQHNPGRHFVAIGSLSPGTLLGEPQGRVDRPLDRSLREVAHHFTELTNLTYDSIVDYYFYTFHKCFPIISPSTFQGTSLQYGDQKCPPADCTVLYLSMLIVILPTLEHPRQPPREASKSLYKALKSAFSQVQTSICSSVRLVQAAMLISLREYAHVRPEVAYVTLTTAFGMAQLLQIDTHNAERVNVTWGMAIVERLIICELDRPDIHPHTEVPDPNVNRPTDLTGISGEFGLGLISNTAQVQNLVALSNLQAANVGQFGRLAQVAYLLHQLLSILRCSTDNTHKVTQLAQLEGRVRTALEVFMADVESQPTANCAPVSICARIYLVLHKAILGALEQPKDKTEHWQKRKAIMALDMTHRMVLEVAHEQDRLHAPSMFVCCFYNLRESRRCLQDQNKLTQDCSVARDIERLMGAEERYHRIWGFVECSQPLM